MTFIRTFLQVLALIFTLWPVSGTAQDAYAISAGDELRIEVAEDAGLNRQVLVLPDGTIAFPFAGTLPVAGRSVSQVQSALADALAPNFVDRPTLFVSVVSLAKDRQPAIRTPSRTTSQPPADVAQGFYVMGEVNKPGRVALSPSQAVTVLQGLSMVGGFTRFAATKRIELRRMGAERQEVYVFDYKRGRGISGATPLRDGDVLIVPERRLFE